MPGIICLIFNLIISPTCNLKDYTEEWRDEYFDGMQNEIYRTEISDKMENYKFSEIVKKVYIKFGAIVFALEFEVAGKTFIRINPSNYVIRNIRENKIHAYVIFDDKTIINKIAKYDLSNEETVLYKNPMNASIITEEGGDELLGREQYEIHAQHISNKLGYLSVCKTNLEGSRQVTGHIIICGLHSSLPSFITPLREKNINPEQQSYIVILTADPPSASLWEKLSGFSKFLIIFGSALNIDDLKRANISYASKAVIIGDDPSIKKTMKCSMQDAQTIFMYKLIKKCNPDITVILELFDKNNVKYLRNFKDSEGSEALFASGEIYLSTYLDAMTCQQYYNPHIVTIIEQLLSIECKVTNVFSLFDDLQQSNIWQVTIPDEFVNKTYSELFLYLLSKYGIITIGLYRLQDSKRNSCAYVYTKPKPYVRMTSKDRLFILSYSIPKEMGIYLISRET